MRINHKNVFFICSYLATIIAANLSIFYFGPAAAIWNAGILIAFDLTARDGLHEAWEGHYLWPKMAGLITAGSLLSWWINANVGQIALASLLAFGTAGLADALIYVVLGGKNRLVKMNGSNFASSFVDSLVFVGVAGLPWVIVPGQIIAKIIGGFVWSVIILKIQAELEAEPV